MDDPQTTALRRRIIREKPFLRKIYEEWYSALAAALPATPHPALEIGSGAGFLSDFVPGLVTSEIFLCPNIKIVLDGTRLPFGDASLRGILMTDVLHHIPRPREFFTEAARCVRPGGRIAMVEPWVSPWSRLIYKSLHHEPFLPESQKWEFDTSGPLSGANGALPWILFERDRETFQREFPCWRLQRVRPFMPFRYLLSGGVATRNLMPAAVFPVLSGFERLFSPPRWAMFAEVTLERTAV